ncbi:hypothetical protein D3C83_271640 [compost metagenome]
MARNPVGRRRRQWNANERKQQSEIAALEPKVDVLTLHLQWIDQEAFRACFSLAEHCAYL